MNHHNAVTDADRARAAELAPHEQWCCGDGCCGCDTDCGASDRQDDIATALAGERAYNEGAADALYGVVAELMPHETVTAAYVRAEADRIRNEATS